MSMIVNPFVLGSGGGGAAIDGFGRLYEEFYWPGRTQEPGSELSLNIASPVTHGLVFCAYLGGARWQDRVSGGRATVSTVTQWFVGSDTLRYGYGKSNAVGEYASYPFGQTIKSITTEHTILVWAALSSLNAFSTLLCIPWANGTWVSPFVAIDLARSSSTSSASAGVTIAGPTNFSAVSDTGFITADNVVRMYAVTRSANDVLFYLNGFQHGAAKTLGTSSAAAFNTGEAITIANRSSSSNGNSTGGTFLLAAIWNRVLSPSEIAVLYLRPLLLQKPKF